MNTREIYKIFTGSAGICTDTRNIIRGSIFIALKGDNFNANKFASEAIKNGCTHAIIDEKEYSYDDRFILVENCLNTLQQLALIHRKTFNIPVIAITGTNGKTTTKELIVSVLEKKYRLTATKGNLNNHIGLPLTLLSINNKTEICLVEMGANHSGEIMHLCLLARPAYGLITNVGHAHLEGFGSFEAIIKTKKELFDYLVSNDGTLFINTDNQFVKDMYPARTGNTYGTDPDASVSGKIIQSDPFLSIEWSNKTGKTIINSKLIGFYNFENIMAAICVGSYFDVNYKDIKEGLEEYIPDNNRSQYIKTKRNTILLDAYNANPTSMVAALNNFLQIEAISKILILGDMLELGGSTDKEHKKVIDIIIDKGVETVFLVGNIFSGQSFPDYFLSFADTDSLIKHIKNKPPDSSTILIKGSRLIELERVVEFL